MLKIAIVTFIGLHGLVHLWYIVLAQRIVEVQPEMGWTGTSGLLPAVVGDTPGRWIATALYAASALSFLAGVAGIALQANWSIPLVIAAALLSSVTMLLFWDGETSMLMEKGALGLLINIGIILLAIRQL